MFALSDTEGPDIPEQPIPGWDWQTALAKFGIQEAPFHHTNGNHQGYSHHLEFAINPVAVNPTKTRFHELAHILPGHTLEHHYEEYQTHHQAIRQVFTVADRILRAGRVEAPAAADS